MVLVRVGWSADSGDAIKTRTQAPAPGRQMPPGFSDYIDALDADPSRDILVLKHQWGAFYGTDLDLQYNLTFALDAMIDLNSDAHERALTILFPRIGEIGTTPEISAKLD